MKKYLLAAALAVVAAPACAQAPAPLPDADPALFVVQDADTIIYLFGTFHLLDGKQAWFNDEVRTAFDASREIVVEAIIPDDPASLQPLILKYAVDPEGRKLSSKLTPEVKAKLDTELAALGIPAGGFEAFEPWFVSTTLAVLGAQKLGLTGEHGPEKAIAAAAKAAGKPLGELESVEKQLIMLDMMPLALQVAQVTETVEQMAKLGELLNPMMAAWASGDNEKLVAMMNAGTAENPALFKALFTDRNAAWADWIGKRLKTPGVVFMAVGAGHLAGKSSVLDMLGQRGLKIERVKGE